MSTAARAAFTAIVAAFSTAVPPEAPAQVRGAEWLSVRAMNAKLDSVEALALTCEKSDVQLARISAISVSGWTRSGPDAPPPPPPYPGIVARLANVYRQCQEYWVRWAIVSSMPAQAEQREAIAFLAQVAQETRPPETGGLLADDAGLPLPYEALGILSRLGFGGRAALQRLHAEGTVRHPAARRRLEGMAAQGFRER